MKKALVIALIFVVMTPLGIGYAESNSTVWDSMNSTTQNPTQQDTWSQTTPEIGFVEGFKTFISLILVIGLIFGIFYFIKKRRLLGLQQNQFFENLGGLPLGNQRSLQIVRMDDRIFILGVSDTIQLIKEVDDPEEVKNIIHKQSHTENDFDFAATLQKQLDFLKGSKKDTIKDGIAKLTRKDERND